MNLPSVATLSTLTDTTAEARLLRRLLELFRAWREQRTPTGERNSAALYAFIGTHAPNTHNWATKQCFHRPNVRHLVMTAANELLGLHGVETIDARDCGDTIEYCNSGDTYTPTLLYSHRSETFRVGDWGTLVERHSF